MEICHPVSMFMKLYRWLLPHSRSSRDTAQRAYWTDGCGGGGIHNAGDK